MFTKIRSSEAVLFLLIYIVIEEGRSYIDCETAPLLYRFQGEEEGYGP